MPRRPKHGIAANVFESALGAGVSKAYAYVQVDPARYLRYMQRAHRLPVRSWQEMEYFKPEQIHPHARRIISSSSKIAALAGMAFGVVGAINYYFARGWGHCAHRHFFGRHRVIRSGVFLLRNQLIFGTPFDPRWQNHFLLDRGASRQLRPEVNLPN